MSNDTNYWNFTMARFNACKKQTHEEMFRANETPEFMHYYINHDENQSYSYLKQKMNEVAELEAQYVQMALRMSPRNEKPYYEQIRLKDFETRKVVINNQLAKQLRDHIKLLIEQAKKA